jgi:membrane associated rhomboid family serine protease
LIIPWRVDVPEERWPFINWLIIIGAIAAFVSQTISINERDAMLPDKMKEYADRSVEDVAKEFKVEEKRLKEIEQAAEKASVEIQGIIPQIIKSADFKKNFIKRAILEEYFVWGKVRPFILNGWDLKGFFGHIWLHGGILHLVGNMLFLWIFGNAVCAKIGNFRYLPIYLGLGLISGFSQLVFSGQGGIGASGAINGVVGMFLVFFPQNEITCYLIFFFPLLVRPYCKEFCMSSYWMILFWLAFDIWGVMKGGGRVAYFAHLGGFTGGFVIAILMLKLKMVTMERYEKSLLQLIADYKNPPKDDFKPQYQGYLGLLQKDLEDQPKPAAANPPELKTMPLAPLIPNEEFIRFACPCGKHLKMPKKFAGKIGKCPKCQSRVKIPDK